MKTRRRSSVGAKAVRRWMWRLGRRLYMRARADVPNEIATNGEQLLQREVLRLLRQRSVNAVMFDVGANVGDWSLSLIAQADATGTLSTMSVHAFEPFPSTFQAFSERLREHLESGILRCRRIALSSADGAVQMRGEGGLGTSSIHIGIDSQQLDVVTVVTRKLDTYCAENAIHEIHLLKCDTEGHDLDVIAGAHGLLLHGKVWFFQFEYNHRWIYSRHYLKDVFDLAESIPYKVAKMTPKGLEVYDRWDPEFERFFEANYVLIRDDVEGLVPTWTVSRDSHNTFVG